MGASFPPNVLLRDPNPDETPLDLGDGMVGLLVTSYAEVNTTTGVTGVQPGFVIVVDGDAISVMSGAAFDLAYPKGGSAKTVEFEGDDEAVAASDVVVDLDNGWYQVGEEKYHGKDALADAGYEVPDED